MLKPGAIVIAKMMPAGRAVIVPQTDRDYILSSDAVKFIPHELLNIDYLLLAINNPTFYNQVISETHGVTRIRTSLGKLQKYLLPIPPLNEQRRIVAKIEELQPFIDEYDHKETELTRLNADFPEALKKSILQEAVMGKLVPQDPNDEPASVLLERIRDEKERLIAEGKIKRDKNESRIYKRGNSYYELRGKSEACIDDEIPFEIPDSWSWSRTNICLDVRDGTHDTPKYITDGIPLVTSKNLRDGRIDMTNVKYISREDHEAISLRSKVDDNDILFAMIGSIGNPVLYHGDFEFSIKNMALFKHIKDGMDMKFVYWWLYLSQDNMKKQAFGGVQSFVSLNYLRNYFIPVPPLNEQGHIVSTIEISLSKISSL